MAFPPALRRRQGERVRGLERMKQDGERHRLYEDSFALATGSLFVALGTIMYGKAMLLFGGVAGLALLLQYVTGVGFWVLFFLVNLPFFLVALRRMGWRFTLRSFIAVSLVCVLSRLMSDWVDFSHLEPGYAAVMGGALCGTGMLIMFRHRTGLGGVNILALLVQDALGIGAGYVQLSVDLALLGAAFLVLPVDHLVLSVLGTVVLNMVLVINHKPGRYAGVT